MHFGYEQRCRRKGPNWTEQSFRWWIHILLRLWRNQEFRFREWVNEKLRLYIYIYVPVHRLMVIKKNRFFPSTNFKRTRYGIVGQYCPLLFRKGFFFKNKTLICFYIPPKHIYSKNNYYISYTSVMMDVLTFTFISYRCCKAVYRIFRSHRCFCEQCRDCEWI